MTADTATRLDGAPARTGWREEARKDRLTRARIERDREEARTRARIAEREAADAQRATRAEQRREARALARADRDARRAALVTWVTVHVTDLLFVPVIAVPGLLAWTAMGAYGASLYGPLGRALPAFSEGAMWAFAAAVTLTRRKDEQDRENGADLPPRPIWHLRLGTAVFAAFGAVLNFAHGLTMHGALTGAVMALVSIAGVTAHQLVTAGPRQRRTRAERHADKIARAVAKRELDARREAVRNARAELDGTGAARLVFTPTSPDTGTGGETDTTPAAGADRTADTGTDTPPDIPADPAPPATRTPTRTAKPRGKRSARPDNAARIARLRARHPDLTAAQIADRLGISARTVRRYPTEQAGTTA